MRMSVRANWFSHAGKADPKKYLDINAEMENKNESPDSKEKLQKKCCLIEQKLTQENYSWVEESIRPVFTL